MSERNAVAFKEEPSKRKSIRAGVSKASHSISSVAMKRHSRRATESADVKSSLPSIAVKQKREFVPGTLPPPKSQNATDFESPEFDKVYFAQRLFTNKTDEEIDSVIHNLEGKRTEYGNTLKKQIFSHYSNFIDSTNNIQSLEKEVNSLRRILTEQQQIMQTLTNTISAPPSLSPTAFIKKLQQESDVSVNDSENKSKAQVLSVFDELDGLIAERRFAKAVDILERELQSKDTKTSHYQKKIQDRVYVLSDLLCRDIQNRSIKKAERNRVIQYLIRMGESTVARDSFLQTKFDVVSREIKEMKVEGELVSYISRLSQKVFSHIAATCKEYQTAFSEEEMMSAFVVWAIQVLSVFTSIFCRQVFYTNEQVINECLEITKQHCLVLENDGLQLSFYLTKLLNDGRKQ